MVNNKIIMDTKVRCDKIKEDSIPFSAFDENIKPIIPNVVAQLFKRRK